MDDQNPGPRERLQSQAEETVGKIAQDLLSNPLVAGAIGRAFEAREKAVQAQEVAFNALNIPSAADIERLTRRVRSVSQRLEGIEDGVDRLDERLAGLTGAARLEERLEGIEQALAALVQEINVLRESLPEPDPGVSRSQERLKVGDGT